MEKANKLAVYFVTGIFMVLSLSVFYVPGNAEAYSRDLTIGKIGYDVRQLQNALNDEGYNLQPADGIYGLRTQQAVIRLQKKNRLKPTGVFDEKTALTLRSEKRSKDKTRKPAIEKPAIQDTAAKTKQVMAAKRKAAVKPVSRGASREDVIMLARAVHGEARGESFQGQVAVAAVIVNRTYSKDFPQTVKGVIFQPGAFDAVSDGQIWLEPDQNSIRAAELALSGYDPTGKALYYWNPAKATSRWIWSRPIITQIGDHVFAK